MDRDVDTAELAFREEVRAWLLDHLPPGWDTRSTRTVPMSERLRHFGRDWERQLHEAGYNGRSWPVEYGGRGASIADDLIFLEEATKLNVPESLNNVAKTMLGPTIMTYGTEDQRARFLPRILNGEHIWCQGFSEPDAGSDLAGVRTRAVRDGRGWRLHGQKLWTSRAQYSDYCFALVRTDPEQQRHAGLSMMLVPLDGEGIEIRPLRQANGDDEFNEVYFDGAYVDDADVLGPVGEGWKVANTILSFERGTAHFGRHVRFRRQLEELVELARTVEVDGVPVVDHPHYRQRLMTCLADVEVYRLLAQRELSRIQSEAVGHEGSFVKLFWTDLYREQQQLALEILGPYANTLAGDDPLDTEERVYRFFSALSRSIAGGTSEIQRNIIAERTLGLPRHATRPGGRS